MEFEFELEDIHLAVRLLLDSAPQKVMLFYGEMGVGKTTFIKELAKTLGVEGATSSPTFSLVNEYHITPHEKLFHFDMYRLKSEAEAYDMGMDEYIYSGHWCLIEWPEQIPNLIPETFTDVRLSVLESGKRKINWKNVS